MKKLELRKIIKEEIQKLYEAKKMKYKVGDKVKIRSWADMKQEFGLDGDGDIKTSITFIKEMKPWCNKVVTIEKIHLGCYFIKEDDQSWSDEMIDHKATKKLQKGK